MMRLVKQSQSQALGAGSDVVVETVFGRYHGVLAQDLTKGSHVRLHCVGHDIWLHQRSVVLVRAGGAGLVDPADGQ